jgi:sulfide:quinone oxidoreductase
VRVVIAGGGVAGLEAALALRELAEERVEIELLAPEPFYWYRPLAVAEPFGVGLMQRVELVEVAAAAGAQFSLASLAAVDSDRCSVWSGVGARFDYDALVVAAGTRPYAAVPGAFTFRGPADVDGFRALLEELEGGAVPRLVFALPGGIVWPLPLYELCLLTAAHLNAHGMEGVELALVTPEEEPLQVFGAAASAALRELLAERGIEFRGGGEPLAFEDGSLATAAGDAVAADRVVAMPRLRGAAIDGLPRDAEGVLAVDLHGRVLGVDGVYAAGDVTSFPVKQGGLAAQQAHAVAETIAAAAGAPVKPRPFEPVLRGLLLTGGIPRYLRTSLTGNGAEGTTSVEPLWWPPAKIAARRLAPFLAGRALQPPAAGAIPVELDFGDRLGGSVVATDAAEAASGDAGPETTDEQDRTDDTKT